MSPGARQLLRRWHRRVGISTAIFVFLLSATGIALNHSSTDTIPPELASWLYPRETPKLIGVAINPQDWLIQIGQRLFINTRPIESCRGELLGVGAVELAAIGPLLLVACSGELQLLLAAGELVESFDATVNISTEFTRFGQCEKDFCLQADEKNYRVNIDPLGLQATDLHIIKTFTGSPPETLTQQLGQYQSQISWQRLWLDLHSGRLFSRWGPWVMDLVAVFFIFLAVSGLIFFRQYR